VIGDPTEAALVVLAQKVGIVKERADTDHPRIFEIPFTSERKKMTTVNKTRAGLQVFSKGACEVILEQCDTVLQDGMKIPLDGEVHARILEANETMASAGLRVLAFSWKELEDDKIPSDTLESGLTFLGMVGMIDPPRTEVVEAVSQCKDAGIKVVMITGDHMLTAMAVGREIGVVNRHDRVMSGVDLEKITAADLAEYVEDIRVYSRVSPEDKIKIVNAFKNRGHIVAMTGDGINDAPALKTADIGIAMGITGTEVTKQSASMVLADDNFATIVSAIQEGRKIFENIRKYLVFLLPSNISEVFILAFSIIAGWPLPLLAKHILFLNLVTDGAPAIALGLEPEERGIMKKKPRDPRKGVFSGTKKWMVGVPILLSVVTVALFWLLLETNGWESDESVSKARTMVFGLMVFFELFFSLSCRSLQNVVVNRRILGNRLLTYSLIAETVAILVIMSYAPAQEVFGLAALDVTEWAIMLGLATSGFVYSELVKILSQALENKRN